MGPRDVAFIGLGGMGAGMAGRLLEAGHPLTVYNRTASKAAALVAAGARAAGSPGEAAERADLVVLSLSDETAVEEVLFGALAGRLRAGTTVVDTSTVSPGYSRSATERLAEAGHRRIEACVVGNPQMARAGGLRIFTAGTEADVAAIDDVLSVLGRQVDFVGPAGAACVLKISFNVLLGAQVVALAEAVALAEGAGLDRDVLLEALTGSGFSAPTIAFRAGFMRSRVYEPAAFRVTLMEKDLRLALDIAAGARTPLPLTAQAAERYAATAAAGRGDQDAAAVLETTTDPTARTASPAGVRDRTPGDMGDDDQDHQ